ncbi:MULTISPECIES: hypothetical protein [unclassified Mycobacterium]|uniref:hypothetical protein n=1 Tax=unclassified Mycobacterium TaxID=2642494 RepID=UPI0038762BC9
MLHFGLTPWTPRTLAGGREGVALVGEAGLSAAPGQGVDPAAESGRSRRRGHRFARAVGVATTATVGALATAVVVPQAAAGPAVATPVRLLSDSLQSAINEILSAQQQVATSVSQLPWVTPYDVAHQLGPYTQMVANTMLASILNIENATRGFDSNGQIAPTPWGAPAADPFQMQNFASADNIYMGLATGDKTWTVTVYPGQGSQDMLFSPMVGDGVTTSYLTARTDDFAGFTPNADGSYTIILSPTEHAGNWVDTQGSVSTLIRDTVGDWGMMHNTLRVHEVGASGYTMPVLSTDNITSILQTLGANFVYQNSTPTYIGLPNAMAQIPFNTVTTPAPSQPGVIGPAVVGQINSMGRFQLEPDQALIIKVADVPGRYSSAEIGSALNNVGSQPGWATSVGQINDAQAFHSSDGFTYYVISAKDPGVANWLDTNGASNGDIALRWQGAEVSSISRPTFEVVSIDDVKDYLPVDTPTVSLAERAVELQNHLLEYGYKINQYHDSGWVTQNLEIDQIKAAIGTEQFDAIFGTQLNVPSVLDRMVDPMLMADPATVIHDLLTTDPGDTFSAIVQNMPTLLQDIQMPVVLAALRLAMLLGSDPGFSGLTTGLGTWLESTFTDPATSITAGFLNARDDLSVVLMNADKYSALSFGDLSLVSDRLSDLHESVSNMLAAGLAHALGVGDSSAVFDFSDGTALTGLDLW